MIDIDEIMRRAQEASEKASKQLNESMEKSKKIAEQMQADLEKKEEEEEAKRQEEAKQAAEQLAAGNLRQVEILGQILSPEVMAQMAGNEALIQQAINEKAAEAASFAMDGLMDQLFGEDMGVIAAALETLAMEEDMDEEDDAELDLALEQELYRVLDENLERIQALPEVDPVSYAKGDPRWEHFGILLSGLLSTLNDHRMDGMDVEEHIPVMEQQIVSLVRRTWGISGRSALLDTIRELTQSGYALRYQIYCEADSPEELAERLAGTLAGEPAGNLAGNLAGEPAGNLAVDLAGEPTTAANGEMDDEEIQSLCRGWRFAQHYKSRYAPAFMTGWDVGRAAMLTRWGCYLGWITEGEAVGILWELSQLAAERLRSWREFAQSYLFGGLMWKLLCGDSAAESYLGYLTDAAVDLLTGKADDGEGQWKECPWPSARKIGF